ncbi:hypothetical protein GpartN1_g7514.t1 [Galdieria partita]|uniref:Uncharacterized protein n=1 Tax=Galdieria partita TaxID=83374 RepID=A0A9C7Q3C4_9RHOD|nr:hypothetical protein GpartN1_g7514.t1 [Galdieria partita]
MLDNILLVNFILKKQVFFILPCRLYWQPRHMTSTLRHAFYCVSQPQRSLLTEEFYLSVGREPRFQSRKPGDLIYPVEDFRLSRKSLMSESLSYRLWFRLKDLWNISFHTIFYGVVEKYWRTRPILYPTKPSYVYSFKEWEQTSRTYYINCFGEKRYLGHIRKM